MSNFSQSKTKQQQNYKTMQVSQSNNFIYEERNQNFPQLTAGQGENIYNKPSLANQPQHHQKTGLVDLIAKNQKIGHRTGVNYSELFSGIKIAKTPVVIENKVAREKNMKIDQQMPQASFYFQSAAQIKNRKGLPGAIVRAQKKNEYSDLNLSHQKSDFAEQQHWMSVNKSKNNFRISGYKEKSYVRHNWHEESDLSFAPATFQQEFKADLSRLTRERKIVEQKKEENKNEEQVSQKEVMKNSRSIGTGNSRIQPKDFASESQIQSSPSVQVQISTKVPQKQQNPEISQKNIIIEPQIKTAKKVFSLQPMQGIHVEPRIQQEIGIKIDRQVHFELQQNSSITSFVNQQTKKQQIEREQINHAVFKNPVVMSVSQVASSIEPKQDTQSEDAKHEININLVASRPSLSINQQQKQPQQQVPQQKIQKQQYIGLFNLQQYSEVYEVLKVIQNSLKATVINVQQMLRSVKKYLDIISCGGLDNIQEFDLPLHKKKTIKNSLFYERQGIVVLVFAYCTHTVKDNLKYLLNMLGYSINNSLILAKVLEDSQVTQSKNRPENSFTVKSDRLQTKRNLDTLRNNNNVLEDLILKLSKPDQQFHDMSSNILKCNKKMGLDQAFYSLLTQFAEYLCKTGGDRMVPFLAVAPNPYFGPQSGSTKYTLVIDAIEVFCYGTKKSKHSIYRPYTQHFLNEMSQYYEIIAFSPLITEQTDKIIDMLDPRGIITHRLYKHHTIQANNLNLKYLDRIGRNMDHIILLDNENGGGSAATDNCIHVPLWKGSKNDTVLAQLCPLLAMIALKKAKANQAVKKVREQVIRNKSEGVKYINFGVSLD